MKIHGLDHVNIRTGRLAEMVGFYGRVLGLEAGPRPPFAFGGAWLYAGGTPIVHLVEVEETPATVAPRLEHFALGASGLASFLARLRSAGIAFDVRRLPGGGIVQVNLHDPDGNHLHVDFPAAELDRAGATDAAER